MIVVHFLNQAKLEMFWQNFEVWGFFIYLHSFEPIERQVCFIGKVYPIY